MSKACENLAVSMNALSSFDSKKIPPKSQFFGTEAFLNSEVQGIGETHINNTAHKEVFCSPAVFNFLYICKNKIIP